MVFCVLFGARQLREDDIVDRLGWAFPRRVAAQRVVVGEVQEGT